MKFVEPIRDLYKISSIKKSCWAKEIETIYCSWLGLIHHTVYRHHTG